MKLKTRVIVYNIFLVIILYFISELTVRFLFSDIQLYGTSSDFLIDSLHYDSVGLKANSKGVSREVTKATNKYNCWKYEREVNLNEPTILYLGDSATMGIGVDNDSTFAGLISKEKNLLNSSLIGYSVEDYKNVLLSFLDKKDSIFNITEVNLFWTLNNIYSSFLINNSPEYKSDSIVFSIVDFLRKNSKLYHLVKNLVSDRSKTYFKFDSHFYQNETNKFTNSINTLKNIIEICIENNIEIKLFLLPYEYQLRDNYQLNNYPQKLIISKLIEEEIKIIDIGDKLSLSNLKTDELFLYSDGIHFSKHGHKQIYKIIVTEEI